MWEMVVVNAVQVPVDFAWSYHFVTTSSTMFKVNKLTGFYVQIQMNILFFVFQQERKYEIAVSCWEPSIDR